MRVNYTWLTTTNIWADAYTMVIVFHDQDFCINYFYHNSTLKTPITDSPLQSGRSKTDPSIALDTVD
jgi:hypothetical protein